MMLHKDDLPLPQPAALVYVECRVRLLIPRYQVHLIADLSFGQAAYSQSYDVDVLTSSQVGAPAVCVRCGWLAINTDGFPWGLDRYKKPLYCTVTASDRTRRRRLTESCSSIR